MWWAPFLLPASSDEGGTISFHFQRGFHEDFSPLTVPRIKKNVCDPATAWKPHNLFKVFQGLFVWLDLVLLLIITGNRKGVKNAKQRQSCKVSNNSTANSLTRRVVPGVHWNVNELSFDRSYYLSLNRLLSTTKLANWLTLRVWLLEQTVMVNYSHE